MCDGRNTLYINTVIGEEEEEVKDDEMRPLSVPVPKMPMVGCYINSEIMTKHSCQQYTADPCWTPLTRSWPREI